MAIDKPKKTRLDWLFEPFCWAGSFTCLFMDVWLSLRVFSVPDLHWAMWSCCWMGHSRDASDRLTQCSSQWPWIHSMSYNSEFLVSDLTWSQKIVNLSWCLSLFKDLSPAPKKCGSVGQVQRPHAPDSHPGAVDAADLRSRSEGLWWPGNSPARCEMERSLG